MPKKILFFTNSDYGQANVVLAAAYELAILAEDVEIHIASFEGLEQAALGTNQLAVDNSTSKLSSRLIFHKVHGRSQFEACIGPDVDLFKAYDRTPTFFNAARTILCIEGIMQPWSSEEFVDLYQQSLHILNNVKPDLTVVEPLFTPGLTLCNHLGINWIVLAPNTIKDFAVPLQPRLAALWKYPIVCSGMPFPLPIHLIPANIALNFVAVYMLLTAQRVKNAQILLKHRVGENIQLMTANELGVLKPAPAGLRILVANSADLDYPFNILPSHVIPCGPIIRPSLDLGKVDQSLEIWLAREPTVYVNLGTHLAMTKSEAIEMAAAFRQFLDMADARGRKLQILWKLKIKGVANEDKVAPSSPQQHEDDVYNAIRRHLGKEMDNDQIRLTNWVTAEPKSVLESGHIICSVNHGGASSFNEALCAGVPQLVLPGWADCYDFANRAELLGIGRWGNKKAKPRWQKDELFETLVQVIFGAEAEETNLRAKKFARKYAEGDGRRFAAEILLDALVTNS
ncbi:UDP-Glycosyltransferase/glycogen phosphorylase [Trichoderma sp. SZMC 28015]